MKRKIKKKKINKSIIIAIATIILAIILINNSKQTTNKIDKTAKIQNMTTIGETQYDISNAIGVNIPTIAAGMIPVKKQGDNWIISQNVATDWYDYANGKPAYMMLNDGMYQSELQVDMTDKKLASENIGTIIDRPGTIYVWIPRFAYNEEQEINYIKQGYTVTGTWTIPAIFTYEVNNDQIPDLSLAGIWVEYSPLVDKDTLIQKVSDMQEENNKYGFIANTIGVNAYTESEYSTIINKYVKNSTILVNPDNQNRTIIKVFNMEETEPLKATAYYNIAEGKMKINVTYSRNGISRIIDEEGNIVSENSKSAEIEMRVSETKLYRYIIIDTLGNILEISVTADDSYIIPDLKALKKFRDEVNAGNDFSGVTIKVVADIDLNPGKHWIDEETGKVVFTEDAESWEPIGTTETTFAGIFDGGYHTISYLYANHTQYTYYGLFSEIRENTTIQNLIMKNVEIHNYSTGNVTSMTGGIIGNNSGKIVNCGVESGIIEGVGNSKAQNRAGGVVGGTYDGSVICCYNRATVKSSGGSENYSAGISGHGNGFISSCYNTGTISATGSTPYAGGIISYATVRVKSDFYKCINSYNIGSVSVGILARNGWDSTTNKLQTNNNYSTKGSGSNVSESTLKTYASVLGDEFIDDITPNINNGYPILKWQVSDWQFEENDICVAIGDTVDINIIDTNKNNLNINKINFAWSSSNTDVATVSNKGIVTGVSEGTTTITATNGEVVLTAKVVVVSEKMENTETTTYIYTAKDLAKFRDNVNAGDTYENKTVQLMTDIDLSFACGPEIGSWEPIGDGMTAYEPWANTEKSKTYFNGTFDGNYYKISNLYANDVNYINYGLFATTGNKTVIKNIIMENVNISNHNLSNTHSTVGGIVGGAYVGKIINCGIESGCIEGKSDANGNWYNVYVGGVVGIIGTSNSINYEILPSVEGCYNRATIKGTITTTNSTNAVAVGRSSWYSM